MNTFDRFLENHPTFRAFFFGMSQTLGIFPVPRYIPTVEESLMYVGDDLANAVQAVNDHRFDRIERAIEYAERLCADGEVCKTPSGAPGDRWTCPVCQQEWEAVAAGPLDIRWRLSEAS